MKPVADSPIVVDDDEEPSWGKIQQDRLERWLYLDQGTSNRAGRGDDTNGLDPNLTDVAAAFRGNSREHKDFKCPSTLYRPARRIVKR